MPRQSEIKLEEGFASAMQQLSAEAAKAIAPELLANGRAEHVSPDEMRREFVALNERIGGLEQKLSETLAKLTPNSQSNDTAELPAQMRKIDEHLVALRSTESVNHRLFNSLHQELKNYRDNFLRDTLQKPVIRDLIVLFDDLSSLAKQMQSAGGPADLKQSVLSQWSGNLDNAIHALLEIMHRMEVREIEPQDTVDRALHKVVSFEPADFAEDDGRIVMRVRRGFMWRDQVLRPEEVVAKRFE